MTTRLTVQRERWWQHAADVAATTEGLVPVVKGNGYGFGRQNLALLAAKLAGVLAVGNVYELGDLPAEVVPLVLTPTLTPPPSDVPILTVGASAHIDALADWGGRVIVKLQSAMNRFGGDPTLVDAAQRAGLRTVGVAIHPPLAGGDDEHRRQIVDWLPHIDPSLDVWVSHLAPDTYASLPDTHRYRIRIGSYLWHGDRGALHLDADVLDIRAVSAGDRAGYHLNTISADGVVAMIGTGTANGVSTLPDGRSPFHFARTRLDLIEPPHMHTSMVFIPAGNPTPQVGDWVDVQRPLILTNPDIIEWI